MRPTLHSNGHIVMHVPHNFTVKLLQQYATALYYEFGN